MFAVTYRGVDGSVWQLATTADGVHLLSLDGLVGSVSESTTPAPGRTGVLRTGLPVVPSMTGTLTVGIRGADALPPLATPDVLRAWRRAWSQLADGELELGSVDSSLLRARVRLADPLGSPAHDPFDHPFAQHELALPVVSDGGCWMGPSQVYEGTGAPTLIRNRGDLQVWPVVKWSGPGPTITGPGVAPLVLPDAPAGAEVNLDPATGTVITVEGEPAPELWSQLRGRSFPTGIPARGPGGPGTAVWTFSPGATATVTPRVLDPWSW